MIRRRLSLGAALLALPVVAWAVTLPTDVPVLALERAEGARLQRAAAALAPSAGQTLREGDRLAATRMPLNLQLHRSGRLQLGPSARLHIAQLPFSSFASELATVFELESGYLHVVWKRPPSSDAWPLEIVIGERRLNLASGEFFFEAGPGVPRACIAGGTLGWLEDGVLQRLQEPGCYRLDAATAASRQILSGADFIALRRSMQWPRPPAPTPARTAAAAAVTAVAAVAAATPEAAAPSVPEPAQAVPRGWTLQIRSMPDRASAERALQRLHAAGHAAVITEADAGGRHWYRVQLRGLPDRAQAQALGRRIERELGYDRTWVAAE